MSLPRVRNGVPLAIGGMPMAGEDPCGCCPPTTSTTPGTTTTTDDRTTSTTPTSTTTDWRTTETETTTDDRTTETETTTDDRTTSTEPGTTSTTGATTTTTPGATTTTDDRTTETTTSAPPTTTPGDGPTTSTTTPPTNCAGCPATELVNVAGFGGAFAVFNNGAWIFTGGPGGYSLSNGGPDIVGTLNCINVDGFSWTMSLADLSTGNSVSGIVPTAGCHATIPLSDGGSNTGAGSF